MTFAFLGTRSQATTAAETEGVPSQAEIEREIAKLKEDSARDVQRQLEHQRSASKEARVEEGVKRVAEDVEEEWKAAEREVETIFKGAEAGVRDIRRGREPKESNEGGANEYREGKRRG